MTEDLTIDMDGERYVVRREDDGLRVGRSMGGEVSWLDTVDESLLTGKAQAALERGDAEDESLLTVLRGVVGAETQRGG